jgi:serine/threonine protein kinase
MQVGDVGLSKLVPMHAPTQESIQDSRLVGTPAYMDPEYMRFGKYSPKSDVYSLGE